MIVTYEENAAKIWVTVTQSYTVDKWQSQIPNSISGTTLWYHAAILNTYFI